jgi:RNA polymerase sigma factor (sigma-70 family)
MMARSQQPEPPVLLAVYLQRRDDLKRYFALRLGSTEAAEDLVQDIYFKIAGGVSGEILNPAAFLYRMGANLMLDRLKQQRRALSRDRGWVDTQSVRLGGEEVADAPPADEALVSRQRLQRMLAALEDLTPACRRAFRLHKLDGLSHAETATAMGVSKSTIEKHISAALKHLLKTLDR